MGLDIYGFDEITLADVVINIIIPICVGGIVGYAIQRILKPKLEKVFEQNRKYCMKGIFVLLFHFGTNYEKLEEKFKEKNEQYNSHTITISPEVDQKDVATTIEANVKEFVISPFHNYRNTYNSYFSEEFLDDISRYFTQSNEIIKYVKNNGLDNVENACSASLKNRKKYALNIIKYIKSNKIRDNSDSHMTKFFELWEE